MAALSSFNSFLSLVEIACVLSYLSPVRLFVTPWTVACQPPPPMGFSRQEYWSGLPFPSVVRFIFLSKARKSPAIVNAGFLVQLHALVHVHSSVTVVPQHSVPCLAL